MNLSITFVLFSCCMGYTVANQASYIHFLNDFNRYENKPTTFSAQTCWTPIEKIRFTKEIQVLTIFTDKTNLELKDPHTVVFLWDLDCPNAIDQLAEVEIKYFAFPYRWILLSQPSATVKSAVFDINAFADSSITLATLKTQNKSITIEQFYKVESNTTTIHQTFGYWSHSTGIIDERSSPIASRQRRNLFKKTMVSSVVLLHNDTINHLTDYKDKNVDSITKVSYAVVIHLLDTLNATPAFTFTDTWGYYDNRTGRVTGMLGELLDKSADLGGTCCFMVADRVTKYEFLSMVTPTQARFIFRPPPLSNVANIYYLPFKATVWAASGLMVLFAGVVIYMAVNRHSDDKKTRISDVALLSIGAVCQMGSHIETKFLSTKISTLFFFIFMLFMCTSYTANIVSLLQATTNSIRRLEDLLQSKFELVVEDTPYNHWYFQNAVDPVRRAIYEKKVAPPNKKSNYVNASFGIAKMQQGMYAMHIERGPGYKLVEDTFYEHEKCGLIEIDYLGVPEPWFVIQKHSPYKEIIKVNMFKIREHGIQGREFAKIYTKKPTCSSSVQSFQSVRIIDCYIVLQVLTTGFVLSILTLIAEKIVYAKAPMSKLNAVCLN